MSDPHWSQMMLPRERIEQLENVNRDLRQQLARAEAKVDLFRRACEGLLDDRPIERAFILRKQAEAVEKCAEGLTDSRSQAWLMREANQLRNQADEAERAGGEK
ncbi:hypothetical protein LL254_00350 [Marinobacter nauticus]|uniref:hypothetical protein n=1 Tax=Marinobacter nauticus TaxID=2743 RepID=UPI001D181A08|nr:hypothetical protein [Marinobacter nauticus]MCC4269156.1 hypothetical protein [Marinobacter nauticus]